MDPKPDKETDILKRQQKDIDRLKTIVDKLIREQKVNSNKITAMREKISELVQTISAMRRK